MVRNLGSVVVFFSSGQFCWLGFRFVLILIWNEFFILKTLNAFTLFSFFYLLLSQFLYLREDIVSDFVY